MKRNKEYTVAIHVKRLEKMLKRKNPCDLCPAARKFVFRILDHVGIWSGSVVLQTAYQCIICQKFVGVEKYRCPCTVLGKQKAIEKTLLAIEEYKEKNK